MEPFEFYSILLWDIVEPVGLIIIAYLLYRIYKELKLIREILEKQAYA